MVDGLASVLEAWRERHRDDDLVIPTMRRNRAKLRMSTLWKFLAKALEELELPPLTWYQATRHTFASHWVLAGNTIEELREIMGHSTVLVTERHAHLRPDLFSETSLKRADLDLAS